MTLNFLRTPRLLVPVAAIAALAALGFGVGGCGSGTGVPQPAAKLGKLADGDVPQVSASTLSEAMLGQTISIEGQVTQQCPAVGCWLIVKDSTGEVFVDLNPAGLRLTEKREGEHAHVVGQVIKQGGEFKLEARSIEFKGYAAATVNHEHESED